MAKLLFSSGFEGDVSLSAMNGETQSIVGTDSATGASWPTGLWNGTSRIQVLTGGGSPSGVIQNSINTVTGHDGSQTQALHLAVNQKVQDVTQDPLLIEPGQDPGDFYISEWIKLPANLAQQLGPGGWMTVGPEWKSAGDFRSITYVTADNSGNLQWRMKWDTNANGNVPLQTLFDESNTSVAVPVGEWIHVEHFTHRGDSDGRTWLKINGETVFDHTGDNIGQNNAPIDRIFLANPYANNAVDILVDDIQIWDGVPPAGTSPAPAPAPAPAPTPTPTPTPTPAPEPTPGSTTGGSGPDTLVLKMSQDAWQGNAQYTVSVDGKQVGGTYTAHAAHSAGASEAVTLHGNWGAGDHTVSVAFLNDAYGGTDAQDRNLYLDGATYNGEAVAGAKATFANAGATSFGVQDATPTTTPATPATPDTLVLKMSQDAWQGNAQYTVSVDGKQVGGTYTAHAAHSAGATEAVTLHGDWGPGDHTVSVAFLNDAYGGTDAQDRNLYVDGATYNGADIAGAHAVLANAGAASFAMHDNVW